MTELPWVLRARQDIGRKEDFGPNDSVWLRQMWAKFNASWLRGQPYCGGAMALWFEAAGFAIPKHFYRAKAWADWGIALAVPTYGCVGVTERKGGGHVTLVVGQDRHGNLMGLGGNQNDTIKVSAFPRDRFIAYRWPLGYPLPTMFALPSVSAERSTSEA